MLHYLRIAVTALSLTACVLLIALWVRSYQVGEFYYPFGRYCAIPSYGILVIGKEVRQPDGYVYYTALLHLPIRWLIVVAVVCSSIPWLGYLRTVRWRFSLRTLLIFMTLVAVGLGMIAISS